jgi:hypothetical protein
MNTVYSVCISRDRGEKKKREAYLIKRMFIPFLIHLIEKN